MSPGAAKRLSYIIDREFNGDLTGNDRTVGWALLWFGFGAPGIASYMSNGQRSDMIKMLRETADRLEAAEAKDRAMRESPRDE